MKVVMADPLMVAGAMAVGAMTTTSTPQAEGGTAAAAKPALGPTGEVEVAATAAAVAGPTKARKEEGRMVGKMEAGETEEATAERREEGRGAVEGTAPMTTVPTPPPFPLSFATTRLN